ncbi:ATP-dependent nuclease [Aurantibacillus circumpalustris]|uniref:ATP-dependent nuclease n=1 Tax=Aurantibacillus circumpalustris TaxID=3036359 RepID=UPI00295A73D2|nr:AAA family ATPase [Aurantibacillus circumpalustris]
MKFELLSGKYKSINSLGWADIPDFVVITGKNGSGKTQLLELLNWHFGATQDQRNNAQRIATDPFHGVKTESDIKITNKDIVYIPSIWQLGNLAATNSSKFTQIINHIHTQITGQNNNVQYVELSSIIEQRIGKPKSEITKNDIQENLPVDYFDYINKIQIHEGLSEAFLTYHCKYAELRDSGKSDEDIKKAIGLSPWEIINNMLHIAGFPYEVNKPKSYIGDYHFELIGITNPLLKINFSDLSSGEKVLISLSIWMFNASKDKRLPKLMLLDEPDAHLHPSAVKQFIDVIEKSLVRNFGVRVIMTTHSPSTVSLAPDYSLFEMEKNNPQIKPLKSKEYGISLLTDGLVVVKSNDKHVLVEDKNDAKFYNEVFVILKNKKLLIEHVSIIFIAASNKSASTSGGCTVVRSWVEKFINEGADDIFQGLMDYDNGTNVKENVTSTKNLHVIKRYSLENYLLDPILIYSSLLHENVTISVPSITLSHRDEHRILELGQTEIQKIADHILSEIEPTLNNLLPDEKIKVSVQFINGMTLLYPKWFLNRRGHDLFSQFKLKYQKAVNYDNLMNALNRQEFIPIDLLEIFKDIQK